MVYASFGWYPILRPHIARISPPPLQLLVKILLCTAICLVLYGILLRIMGLTADLLEAAPIFNLVLLTLGVLNFLVMDLALNRLTVLWHVKLRKRFFR